MGEVLLFSTVAAPERAARLHAEKCPLVVAAERSRTGKTHAIRDDLPRTIADLNERGFPVKRCKCLKMEKNMPKRRRLAANMRQLQLPFRGKLTPDLRRRYDFFREHAGWIVGENAKNAWILAQAEIIAKERGWTYNWEEEQEAWETFLGDIPREDVSEVLWVELLDEHDEQLASLGGILTSFDSAANRTQKRVFEAELASEAAHDLGLL